MLPSNANKKSEKTRPLVKETISITLFFSDMIAMSLSFILALLTAQFLKDLIFPGIYNKPLSDYTMIRDLFFVWMCPIVLFLFFTKGHYTQRVPWWSQVQNVLSVCLMALIMDGFIRFALDMSFSRLLIGLSWVYVFFLTLTGRQIVYAIARKKNIWRIPTILIGDINTITDVLFAFNADLYTGYDIKTVSLRDREAAKGLDMSAIPAQYKDINVIHGKINYHEYIQQNIDHFFVISLETFRGEERDELINALTELKALYAIVPPVSRVSLFEMEPRYFFGYDIMLLHAKTSIFSPMGRFLKRTMDIGIASAALICLSPVILSVMALLKIEGQGGSFFYGGYRIGRNGNKFKCWKLQSMEPNTDHLLHELLERDPEAKAQWEEFRKLRDDPRVTTKTARIIRKTSIDELPQLWNVIIGDMSLVGPRPILDEEVPLFGDAIKHYYQVRPGITGLWQVSGRSDASFDRRVYWDGWYVRNWSVWGDIVIMIKTLRVVLGGSGAY
ncbi:MAG: hypothetical protein COA45_01240 [Zetaproteobacteria bacterium]|nr:MAG: hypothetical protein COA45_01240 [Zetaproteobacteria bacterium]